MEVICTSESFRCTACKNRTTNIQPVLYTDLKNALLLPQLVPPQLGRGCVALDGGANISPLDVAEHDVRSRLICLYDGRITLGGVTRAVRLSIEPVPGNALVSLVLRGPKVTRSGIFPKL